MSAPITLYGGAGFLAGIAGTAHAEDSLSGMRAIGYWFIAGYPRREEAMSKPENGVSWATYTDRDAFFLDPASERSAGLMLSAFRSRWEDTGPDLAGQRYAGDGPASVRASGLFRSGDSFPVASADFPAVVKLAKLDGSNGFAIHGPTKHERAGYSASYAGDVNGDGFDDIIIGAPSCNPGGRRLAGQSYVVFGTPDGFSADFDLSTVDGTNGFRVGGLQKGSLLGSSVSSAGDVNGDGVDDFVVGAQQGYIVEVDHGGDAYVVFGRSDGFPGDVDLGALDGTNGFRLRGVDDFDHTGRSVACAGDINGDGFDDVIIGAWWANSDGGLDTRGASYVVFGKASGFDATIDLASLDGTNGFRVIGAGIHDESGRSVASAGDINGDGFDDLIIQASAADPLGRVDAGESVVVFGKAGGFAPTIDSATLDGTDGFRIVGAAAYDYSGRSASAGDINGDGFDDLIIGAVGVGPDPRDTGAAYVIFGHGGTYTPTLELAALDGSNGFTLGNDEMWSSCGWSVSSAGDVNADGFDDILVSAPNAEPGGTSYVVFGRADGFAPTFDLTSLDGTNGFTIEGRNEKYGSGWHVAAGGDLNADGFDDVLVSGNPSETCVIYGSAPSTAVTRVGSVADQTIRGGAFGDTLSGMGGDDRLAGGAGADVLDGGAGRDRADYDTASAGVNASLSAPASNTGDAAGDTYISIENLQGSDYNDKLAGDAVANRIEGRAGADSLDGRNGDDKLAGEAGHDSLKGGKGADRFEFSSLSADDSDTIGDFAGGSDKIALDGGVFGLPEGALGAGAFAVGAAAGDGNDRLIYNAANGNLFFDADGTGAGAQILIATLTGAPTLAASDIIVV